MLKRSLPNTPNASASPLVAHEEKRFRDHASPVVARKSKTTKRTAGPDDPLVVRNATPLRNQISVEDDVGAVNDDRTERHAKRAVILQKKKTVKAALLSPAPTASPKAAAPSRRLLSAANAMSVKERPAVPASPLLSTDALPAAATMSIAQMNRHFEDWIRAAADNKITAKNSWNVALIDYFSEMTFLKDEAGAGGINFQKASCTLDGCVKIYSSRVDSAVEATTKLLSGLSSKADAPFGEKADTALVGEELGGAKSRRRAVRQAETLEKSWDALTMKQLDPMMDTLHLMRANIDFDEAGSRGLLLYSLELSADGEWIMLDSTVQQAVEDAAPLSVDAPTTVHLPDLSMPICPSLDGVSFFGDSADLGKLQLQYSPSAAPEPSNPFQVDHPGDTSNPMNNDNDYNDYAPADSGDDDVGGNAMLVAAQMPVDEEEGQYGPISDSRQPGMLAYFDESTVAWAGPEHWKIRRRVGFAASRPAASVPKEPRRKAVTVIDFGGEGPDAGLLFAKPANASTITLTQQAITERAARSHCLPDDLHFSSANLLGLFCKPNWRRSVASTRRLSKQPPAAPQVSEEHVDNAYWIDQVAHESGLAADQAEGRDDYNEYHHHADDDDDDRPIGADAELGFSLSNEAAMPTIDFSTALGSNASRNALPFARQAKHINIQHLKQALWRELGTAADSTSGKRARKKQEAANTFSNLLAHLPEAYKADSSKSQAADSTADQLAKELGDITVPYCFICLLHLANEHGLELQGDEGELRILSPMATS